MASESKVEWPPQATMPEEIWLTFGDPHWWPTEEEGDIKYVRADAEQLIELRKAAKAALEVLDAKRGGYDHGRVQEACDGLQAALNPSHLQQETQ